MTAASHSFWHGSGAIAVLRDSLIPGRERPTVSVAGTTVLGMISMPNGRRAGAGDSYSQYYRSTPGPCDGCGAVKPRVVDHCHVHQIIRGELCRSCNTGGMRAQVFLSYRKRCPHCRQLPPAFAIGTPASCSAELREVTSPSLEDRG